jgi:hypothetical protein
MDALLALIALGAAAALWLAGLRARERAVQIARERCRRSGLQLLDDTVVLAALRPARRTGRLCWRRRYDFEFTDTGELRRRGRMVLVGLELEELTLEPHRLPP